MFFAPLTNLLSDFPTEFEGSNGWKCRNIILESINNRLIKIEVNQTKNGKQDIYMPVWPMIIPLSVTVFLPLFLFIILPCHTEVLKFCPHWNHGKFFLLCRSTGNIFSTLISSWTVSCYLKSWASGLKKDRCHLYGRLKIIHGMWLSGKIVILLSLSDKDMV